MAARDDYPILAYMIDKTIAADEITRALDEIDMLRAEIETAQTEAETHCWEDGGGSTCLLPDGHDRPHDFTPDSDISVRFTL